MINSRIVATAVFALCTFVIGSADAAPRGVRLSLFDDPSTSIAVSWNSDSATETTLYYGTTPSDLSLTQTATATSQASPLNNTFTARMTGLTPNTTYYYRVGSVGNEHPATGSPPFEFTTMDGDTCAPYRFILIGDNRADTDGVGAAPIWPDILAETMAHSPDFFVNTGDMVKNGDDPVEWSGFIDASEGGWAYVPSILTVGNHDDDDVSGDGAMYNQLFELPRNTTTNTEDYYSIDIGPVHFVSVNTQMTNPGSTEFSDMLAWLTADLGATSQPWKIVFFHKAIYSRGNHETGEEDNGSLNANLIPIFDQHNVDLVFNGHSHDYERYAPSKGVDSAFGGSGRTLPAGNGASLPAAVPDGDTGTTYMVSGGAGSLTTDVFGFTCLDAACTFCTGFNINCDGDVFSKDQDATVVYSGKHNYAIFDVDGDMLTVTVWTTTAGNTDTAEIIDTFTMTQATPNCGINGNPDAGPSIADAAVNGNEDATTTPPDDGSTTGASDAGGTSSQPGGCCQTGSGDSETFGIILLLGCLLFLRRRR